MYINIYDLCFPGLIHHMIQCLFMLFGCFCCTSFRSPTNGHIKIDSLPRSNMAWVSPYLQVNMEKLSFQHTCEQGTVLIGPHLQTWQRLLRWLVPWVGSMGNDVVRLITYIIWFPRNMGTWNGFICNTQWTDIQIRFHGSQKRTSAIPSPHSKRKAAALFFCRVAISLGDFRLEGGANVGKCSKLLTSLEPLAFSASGLLQMSFFENIEIWPDMETYLNILGSNSTQTPRHREWH